MIRLGDFELRALSRHAAGDRDAADRTVLEELDRIADQVRGDEVQEARGTADLRVLDLDLDVHAEARGDRRELVDRVAHAARERCPGIPSSRLVRPREREEAVDQPTAPSDRLIELARHALRRVRAVRLGAQPGGVRGQDGGHAARTFAPVLSQSKHGSGGARLTRIP